MRRCLSRITTRIPEDHISECSTQFPVNYEVFSLWDRRCSQDCLSSQLHLLKSGGLPGSAQLPLLSAVTWKLPHGSKDLQDSCQFLLSQGSLVFSASCQCFENHCFSYFVQVFVLFSDKSINWFQFKPSWLEAEDIFFF